MTIKGRWDLVRQRGMEDAVLGCKDLEAVSFRAPDPAGQPP